MLALGLLCRGQSALARGEVASGLRSMDEAMVSVTTGEVSPIPSGIVYSAVIEACVDVFELRRAAEWTESLHDWCSSQPDLVPYRGQCLVHRSQLLQVHGDWAARHHRGRARGRAPRRAAPPGARRGPLPAGRTAPPPRRVRRRADGAIGPRASWAGTRPPGSPCCDLPKATSRRRHRRSVACSPNARRPTPGCRCSPPPSRCTSPPTTSTMPSPPVQELADPGEGDRRAGVARHRRRTPPGRSCSPRAMPTPRWSCCAAPVGGGERWRCRTTWPARG